MTFLQYVPSVDGRAAFGDLFVKMVEFGVWARVTLTYFQETFPYPEVPARGDRMDRHFAVKTFDFLLKPFVRRFRGAHL